MSHRLLAALLLLCPPALAADIGSFGGAPDDHKDDTAAFLAALRSAEQHPGTTINLARGRYDLAMRSSLPDGSAPPLLVVKGAKDLTIDGHGAALVVHDFATLFWFNDCHNLTLRDFSIDYDPLPFTAGKVIATGKGYLDLEIAAGHPLNAGLRAQSMLPWDPVHDRIAAGWHGDLFQPDIPERTQKVSDHVLRVPVLKPMFKVGDSAILRHQIYSKNALDFRDSGPISTVNVTVFSCPGMAFHAWGGADVTLDHFTVAPKGGRWFSANADATHFAGVRGHVTLNDCKLVAMGDDGVNCHNYYLKVTQADDDRTFHVTLGKDPTWDIPLPRPGDTLEIGRNPDPLLPYATVKVASAKLDPDAGKTEKTATLTLTEPLQAPARPDDVVGDASMLPALTVHHCTIGHNRARGVLVQTRHATVDHNTFEDVSGAAVQVTCDASFWWEGMTPQDVTIEGNTIRRCNYSIASRVAAIDVFADVGPRPPVAAGPGAMRNITIKGNAIENVGGAGVHVSSATDVRVLGNTIDHPAKAGVIIDHAAEVTVENNKVTGDVPAVVKKD